MIVRILGEGQLEVPDDYREEMNSLSAALADAVSSDDDTAFRRNLAEMLDRVWVIGTPLREGVLVPSDVVLPGPGSNVTMVAALLSDLGVTPG